MLFVIHAFDKKDGAPIRASNYPAHRAYLDNAAVFGVSIVTSGPLVADDSKTAIGSLLIIDAPDRKTIDKFHHADPFFKAGLWDETTVTAFDKKR